MVNQEEQSTHSMLRGPTSQRAKRTEIDTGTGVKRIADEGRGAHIKRGMFVNEQKDLGFNTTEAHAKQVRKEEKDFQGKVKQDELSIGKAQGTYEQGMQQIQGAYNQINSTKIPSVNEMLNQSWNQAEKSFVTVRFMGPGDEIIRTAKMPRDAVIGAYVGKKGIWASEHGNFFNVAMKERHHTQQLAHDSVKAAQDAKTSWMAKNAPAAKKTFEQSISARDKAIAEVKAKEGEFHKSGVQIAAARGQLKGAKDTRAAMWQEVRGEQANKIATMKEIFSKFSGGK